MNFTMRIIDFPISLSVLCIRFHLFSTPLPVLDIHRIAGGRYCVKSERECLAVHPTRLIGYNIYTINIFFLVPKTTTVPILICQSDQLFLKILFIICWNVFLSSEGDEVIIVSRRYRQLTKD